MNGGSPERQPSRLYGVSKPRDWWRASTSDGKEVHDAEQFAGAQEAADDHDKVGIAVGRNKLLNYANGGGYGPGQIQAEQQRADEVGDMAADALAQPEAPAAARPASSKRGARRAVPKRAREGISAARSDVGKRARLDRAAKQQGSGRPAENQTLDDDKKKPFDPSRQAVLPQLRQRPREMLPEDARKAGIPVLKPGAWGPPDQCVRIQTHFDEAGNKYWETDSGIFIDEELEKDLGLVRPPQWTAEEVKIFDHMHAQHGANLQLIAQQLAPSKTVADIVSFYWNIWKLRGVPEARNWADGKQYRAELQLRLLRNQERFVRAILQKRPRRIKDAQHAADIGFSDSAKFDRFSVNYKGKARSIFNGDTEGHEHAEMSNGYAYLLSLLQETGGKRVGLATHLKNMQITAAVESQKEKVRMLQWAARQGEAAAALQLGEAAAALQLGEAAAAGHLGEPGAAGQQGASSMSGSPQGSKHKRRRTGCGRTNRAEADDAMDVDEPQSDASDAEDPDYYPLGHHGKRRVRTRRPHACLPKPAARQGVAAATRSHQQPPAATRNHP